MSRGLGDVQVRALAALSPALHGLTVAELSLVLGIEPRQCRKILASLARRGQVALDAREVAGTGGARRAWTVENQWRFLRAQQMAEVSRAERLRGPDPHRNDWISCNRCGNVMPLGGRY